jgi:hypothetical protein
MADHRWQAAGPSTLPFDYFKDEPDERICAGPKGCRRRFRASTTSLIGSE